MPSIYFKIPPREWLFDEKLNALGLEHKGAWANLLALTKLLGRNGELMNEVDEPLEQSDIIRKARIQAIHFNKFIVCEMVSKTSKDGKILYSITNWLKYQSEYDRTQTYRNSVKDLNKIPLSTHETRLTSVLHPNEPNSGVANLHPKGKYSHKVIKANTKKTQ